jgi:hypothetical protein
MDKNWKLSNVRMDVGKEKSRKIRRGAGYRR